MGSGSSSSCSLEGFLEPYGLLSEGFLEPFGLLLEGFLEPYGDVVEGEGIGVRVECVSAVAMADLRLSLPEDGSGGHRSGRSGGLSDSSFKKLGADLESLIDVPDKECSDLTVVVDGKKVPVHRCILAARCSGLRQVVREMELNGNSKLELELDSIVDHGKIGYDAFMAVMRYVYGGKLEPWPARIACYDSSCDHLTCRPAVDYVLEILCASLLLNLPEVKTVAEV